MNKPQKYHANQERELLRLQCELARLKLRATQMQAASQQDNLVQMLWGGRACLLRILLCRWRCGQ